MKQTLKDSPQSTSIQHNILIQYLDQFGKQMSSRKNNSGLEQQLSSLSKAYNQAQQKLLQTQKTLMSESILIEKQRSIIELYKYILGQQMEDEGILTFIQHLEEQQQNKREIYEELSQLKNLLDRKKLKNCKKSISGSKNVRQLKNEVQRLQQQQKSLSEESVFIYNQNQGLKDKVKELAEEVMMYRTQLQMVTRQLGLKNQQLLRCEQALKFQRQQNRQRESITKQLESKNKKLLVLKDDAQNLLQVLKSRLNIHQDSQKNKQNINNASLSSEINKQYVRELDEKLTNLVKYKQQYKKLKENYRECELHKRQISLFKLFVSQEALVLFKEYKEHSLDCLETQIRNLAVLQKNKLLRLQECERQIWKYRLQLMKQEQNNSMLSQSVSFHQNRMTFSKQTSTNKMNALSTGHPMIRSVTANGNVSEFDSNN